MNNKKEFSQDLQMDVILNKQNAWSILKSLLKR